MVKLDVAENLQKQPIGVLAALSSGFDIVSNQLGLLLVPIALDVFLWLGPRLRAVTLGTLVTFEVPSGLDSDALLSAQNFQESLQIFFEQYNLFAFLRPTLLGVPGLMGGESLSAAGDIVPLEWQVTHPLVFVLTVVILIVLGLGMGGVYWSSVARYVRDGRVDWLATVGKMTVIWPRMVGLTLVLIVILLAIWTPTAVIGSLFGLASGLFGLLIVMLALSLMTWMFFYATFSIHGIVLYNQSVIAAIRTSIWFGRVHFWSVLGILTVFIAVKTGMDIVWNLVAMDSWLWIVPIAGHAFLVTGMMLGTMLFYVDRVPIPSSALVPN